MTKHMKKVDLNFIRSNMTRLKALNLIDNRSKSPKIKMSAYDKRKKGAYLKPSVLAKINELNIKQEGAFKEIKTESYFRKIQRDIKSESNKRVGRVNIDWTKANKNTTRLLKMLKNTGNKSYTLEVGDAFVPLTPSNYQRFEDLVQGRAIEEFENGSDPAVLTYNALGEHNEMILQIRDRASRPEGGFFPYLNKTIINLEKYGVYNTVKPQEKNCLIQCFKAKKIDTTALYEMCKNQYIPQIKLREISEKLNVQINFHRVNKDFSLDKVQVYNKNPELEKIEISCILNHYFLYEKIPYTTFSIKNYHKIKHLPNWNNFYKLKPNGKYASDPKRYTTSLECFRLMIKNKDDYFTEITGEDIYKLYNFKKIEKPIFENLHYNSDDRINGGCIDEHGNGEGLNSLKDVNESYFFDFETDTQGQHKEFMVYSNKHRHGFRGENCGRKLLNSICSKHGMGVRDHYRLEMLNKRFSSLSTDEKQEAEDLESIKKNKIRMLAHNLQYDWRFIHKFIEDIETIELDGRMIYATGVYKSFGKIISIIFVDTLNMLNMPLKKFQETFQLDCKKELIPYGVLTIENINKKYVHLDECLKHLHKQQDPLNKFNVNEIEKMDKEFLANCKEWNCITDDDYVDVDKYAGEYCYMDCKTLEAGWNKFKAWVQEAIDMDIDHYLTLASLSNGYLTVQGCFGDCYKIGGVPRAFIQKCVVGGRTMTRSNTKYHIKDVIDDFDANSLYPSAMERLGREHGGFLKGIPKVIEKFEPEKYDGYFVCIRIKKVGKHRQFPLCSKVRKGESRNFTNDMIDEIVYVDKFALEDLIKFQEIDYEFINGYYFDDGRNDRIAEKMKHLYDQRKKFKKVKNPIQLVFKEVMNSAYGKTIMKPQETEIVYNVESKIENFMKKNHNHISIVEKLETFNDDKTPVEYRSEQRYKCKVMKTIDDHFSSPHIGVEVLSMSKRIMNEVMCLAEDLNLDMYYQDTDSIHIKRSQVPLLDLAFKDKYNRELIGKELQQFSSDFDLEGAVNVRSTESFFLGKKNYFDKLEGEDKNAETVYGGHARMKGISSSAIESKANELNCSIRDLYYILYYGQKPDSPKQIDGLTFNLACNMPKFVKNYNNTICSKFEFNRRISFNPHQNDIENLTCV